MVNFKKVILLFVSSLMIFSTSLLAKDISAYLVGAYVDTDTATKSLKNAGYEVLATYKSVKNGQTIVFTNDALKAEGAKPKRAHAAVLRLFVDDEEQMISITNPVYFGKAFMQDDYEEKVFDAQLKAINSAFPNLKGSLDKKDFDDLADYHFMFGMPYYEDIEELSEGSQAELITRAREYKNGKLVIFELKLSDTSTLFGYALGKKTSRFVKKVGRANAAVLPYCISIENGVATSLAGKYYLAVSYPLLSMGEFMTISSVPGAITNDLRKTFKKVTPVREVNPVTEIEE